MLAVMITPLDSLEAMPANRSRKSLHRTRTLDGSYPNSSFGRLDKDSSVNNQNGVNGTTTGKQQGLKTCKEKKNVSFQDESKWECHTLEPYMDNESQLAEFWVLPDELKEIKMQGFLACKEAKRSGLAALLTEIYGTGNRRENQDRLNYWCRMAPSCRGLERFANEELSKRRTIFRKRAIVSVLEAQQQLKNEKGIDTANVLRRLSEAYTEQARAFAVSLGTADYHAIQTVKAPPPPPASPPKAAAAANAAPDDNSTTNDNTTNSNNTRNGLRGGKRPQRKSRTERMKERAAAADQKNNQQQQNPQQQQQQQQQEGTDATQQGENGLAFRRNNTTMTAVVHLKQ